MPVAAPEKKSIFKLSFFPCYSFIHFMGKSGSLTGEAVRVEDEAADADRLVGRVDGLLAAVANLSHGCEV